MPFLSSGTLYAQFRGPCNSEGRENMTAPVTIADSLRAVPIMRREGVLGVDAFEKRCRESGPSKQVVMPHKFMDALVAENIDYTRVDRIHTAFAKYARAPFCPELRTQDAVRCETLRQIAIRAVRRRPRWARPFSVSATVRCALLACMRSRLTKMDPDKVMPLLSTELRMDPIGLLTLPGTISNLRSLALATICSLAIRFAARRTFGASTTFSNLLGNMLALFCSWKAWIALSELFSEHVDAKYPQDQWQWFAWYASVGWVCLFVVM